MCTHVTHIYLYVSYMYTPSLAYTDTPIAHVCVHMYIDTQIHTYCTYPHTYTHTHTHTF